MFITGPVTSHAATTAARAPHAAQHFGYRPVPAVEARQFRHGKHPIAPASFGKQSTSRQKPVSSCNGLARMADRWARGDALAAAMGGT
jgi:hypothetical protein